MKPLRHVRLRFGIILQGRQLWVSELVSILFLSVACVLLVAACVKIVSNEYTIHKLTIAITEKKSDRIVLAEYRQQLRDKVAITELLCSIAGKKLASDVLVNLAGIVYENSVQFGYDPLLLLAVIEVESVFKLDAVGRYRNGEQSGAMGLMQIKPQTAHEVASQLHMPTLSDADLLRPEINIALGVSYLTRMITKFKSFKLGLLAYNQGPAVVNKHLAGSGPISIRYYRKVLGAYYTLKKKAQSLSSGNTTGILCK